MGKPSAPTPPDPKVTVPEQTKSNVQTATASAALNAVDQSSPYGTVKYDKIGSENIGGNEVPRYQQTTTLSPEQQQLYNSQTGLEQKALDAGGTVIGNAQNAISSPFSLQGLPSLQTSAGSGRQPLFGIDNSNLPSVPLTANDFAKQGQQTQDAVMSRFNEDFPKREEDSVSRLNAQGIQRGSAGYNNEMDTLNRSKNDALSQAILAGNQEQGRLFDQASQSRGQVYGENQGNAAFTNAAQGQDFAQSQANAALGNQGRQQSIAEQQLVRNQPINEFATLLGLGGNIQTPTGAPNFGINVNPTDVLGAYGMQQQGQMNNYNQKSAANSALWGALLGGASKLGSAAILAP